MPASWITNSFTSQRPDSQLSNASSVEPAEKKKLPWVLSAYILLVGISGFACGIRGLPWWYQFALAWLLLSSMAFLWITNRVDPGRLPRSLSKDPVIALLENSSSELPDRQMYTRSAKGVWMRRVNKNGTITHEKYCHTCNIWRPPRASHCNVCGYCMERYDHHCGVVGNCIAMYNHRFFALFLLSAQAGLALLTAGCAWRISDLRGGSGDLWDNRESFVLVVLLVIYGYQVLMLLFGIAHCCFVITDITSKDIVADPNLTRNLPCCPGQRNPVALARAWRRTCCGPVHWRAPSEDQELPPIAQHDTSSRLSSVI